MHYDGGALEQPDEGLSPKEKKQIAVGVTLCCIISLIIIVSCIFSSSKEEKICDEYGCHTYKGAGYLNAKQRAAQRAADNESSCAGSASDPEANCV